jgi:hypothetical protein
VAEIGANDEKNQLTPDEISSPGGIPKQDGTNKVSPAGADIEWAKLQLEQQKAANDFNLRQHELELKTQELQHNREEILLKKGEIRFSRWTNPLALALIAGIITFYQNNQAQRAKTESDLLIEAIKSGDPDKARENLLFLADAGRLQDADAIRRAIKLHSPYLPGANTFIPAGPTPTPSLNTKVLNGTVGDESGRPLPSASVVCDITPVIVGHQGQFQCPIPAGASGVTVHITASGFTRRDERISAEQAQPDKTVPLVLRRGL